MKRIVWLVPVLGLIACAEREKQVEATPSPTAAEQPVVEPVKAGKFNGISVKKPFVAPGGAVATASASASAK